MENSAIKRLSSERLRLIVATVIVALLVLALPVTLMLHGGADTSGEVPEVNATVNDDGEAYINLLAHNLEFGDYLHMMYAFELDLPEGVKDSEVRMIFWNEPQSSYLKDNENIVDTVNGYEAEFGKTVSIGSVKHEGVAIFRSSGIAAKEIGDTVYARAYVTDEAGNTYYSRVDKYSVLQYVHARYRQDELGTDTITDNQRAVYEGVLRYGASAQNIFRYKTDRLVSSHTVRVEAVGGYITYKQSGESSYVSDGFSTGVYFVGDSVTLNALEGKTRFIGWRNGKGTIVSTDRSYSFTVTESIGSDVYTAVYESPAYVTVSGGTLSDGSVSGEFASGESYTIVANDRSAEKYVFSHWIDESGETVGYGESYTAVAASGESKSYTAVYFDPVTVTVSGGSLEFGDTVGVFAYGEEYVVIADDLSWRKSVFSHWENGDHETVGTSDVYVGVATEDITLTACYYEPMIVRLDGGTLASGDSDGVFAFGESFTATASDRSEEKYAFKHWINEAGRVVSTSPAFTLEVTEEYLGYVGSYTAVYYSPVTVTVSGGTLLDGSVSGLYAFGESYTVTADDRTDECYHFVCWQNAAGDEVSRSATYSAAAGESDVSLTAIFEYREPRFNISVVGGTLDDGKTADSITSGSEYTVTANDRSTEKYVFKHWLDADGNTLDYGESFTAVADADTSYTAVYYEPTTVNVTGGTLLGGETSGVFAYGEQYFVVAATKSDVRFVHWTLNGEALSGTSAITTFSVDGEGETLNYVAVYGENSGSGDSGAVVDPYADARKKISAEAVSALIEMDDKLFSADIYKWIANLYDPETSAIYFSISGRDNYGYLPDAETVSQAYGLLNTLGLGSASSILNDEQKANLLSWAQQLQSNRDGYFYHPHWGVSISSSRRSRDSSYISAAFSASSGTSYRLYNDAVYRLSLGTTGTAGVTVSTAYDNNVTGVLGVSVAEAVSRLVLASTSSSNSSSMPSYLLGITEFTNYINAQWNTTCHEAGVHERHICTSSCKIVPLEDDSDSYMKIENGELVFVRGYKCTSHHECKHSLGHSYSFGHTITCQNSQIAAAGLGRFCVEWFWDCQENVQASLRNKAKADYITANTETAWNALSSDEQTAIMKAAENGLWEETVIYGTISGLLKICGIPSAHKMEFKYAEAACASALEVALRDDYIERREAIVSIYNPFNAISGIMGNVTNYGSDKTVNDRVIANVRANAVELINDTADKLMCYKQEDGGYSYNMDGYCVNSQGQPVAVSGWGGKGEGDVNGTALALGARGALVKCLGITVGKPFAGTNALYKDADGDTGYDLDCNGIIENEELEATHTQVFQSLITNKGEIQKVDTTSLGASIYDFEGEGPMMPNYGDAIISTQLNGQIGGVLKYTDNSKSSGAGITFPRNTVIDSSLSNDRMVFKTDMKLDEFVSGGGVVHQFYIGNGGSTATIDMTYTQNTNKNKDTYQFSLNALNEKLYDESGSLIKVNPWKWFNVEIEVYHAGKLDNNGITYYIRMSVTQDGVTRTGYFRQLKSYSEPSSCAVWSMVDTSATINLDNVSCSKYIFSNNLIGGEYHFDTRNQQLGVENKLTASPTNTNDKVYLISGDNASFPADQYDESRVIYNFNSMQASVLLKDAVPGDRVYFIFEDAAGHKITGTYLTVNADGTVTFFSPNGKAISATLLVTHTSSNGNVSRVFENKDMTLNVDLDKWMVIKLEYHYDLTSPQYDLVVRYADESNYGYNRTVSACLTDVKAYDSSADARGFTNLSIIHQSTADGKIYVDDIYTRNTFVNCTGTHKYVEIAADKYATGTTDGIHNLYYLSCQYCGVKSSETFAYHVYTDKKVSEDTLKSAADESKPARYYYSCKCGDISTSSYFEVGEKLEVVYSWSYNDFTKGSKGDISIGSWGNTPYVVGRTWATVLTEKVGDAVNHYLNVGKFSTGSTIQMTLGAKTTSDVGYAYEFDLRWGAASDLRSGNTPIIVKIYDNKGEIGGLNYSTIASSDGTQLNYYGSTFKSGEWHKIRYVFVKNDGGYNCSVYIDGFKHTSFEVKTADIPRLFLEFRYGDSSTGRNTDILCDFDNVGIATLSKNASTVSAD